MFPRTLGATALALGLACGGEPPQTAGAPGANAQGFTDPTPKTVAVQAAVASSLPLADQQDFEDAKRGLVANDPEVVISGAQGERIWDTAAYAFVQGDAPASVNPSLWRQAKLNGFHGLFEVAKGIYQVRGYDISNLTLIQGQDGLDPGGSAHEPGDRGRRARARAQTPRAAPGRRRDLHAQPHRPLRRHRRRALGAGGGEGRRAHRGPARLRRRSRQRERAGGRRDGPAGDLHVRDKAAARRARARRHGPRQGARPGHHRAAGAERSHRSHAAGADARRRALRVPVRAGFRGARRAHLLSARREGLVRGRDRLAHAAQSLHPARRQGARRAALERLHRRGAHELRRRRGRVREPSLAGVGKRAGRRLSEEAARHLPLHPRSDAAARESGPDAAGDRGADRAAGVAGLRFRRPRLLRHAATRCEGGLRFLLRLVRCEPGESRSAPARRGGRALRRGDGRRGGGAAQGAGRLRSRRVSLGGDAAEPPGVRGSGRRARPASCWRAPTTSSATRRSPVPGATCT